MMDRSEAACRLHKECKGKLSTGLNVPVRTREDLALAYTPGVAAVCREISKNRETVFSLTIKSNTVAVVSDGSAVLGLGNIGAEAALPVMEGKALLLKRFAGVDSFPLCLDTQDPDDIIETVRRIAPTFGGINLEDIAAPKCFTIEKTLQGIDIPVFHDDQHGTAITTLAALVNAAKVAKKNIDTLRVVIAGAGAAGTAVTSLLAGDAFCNAYGRVRDIIVCDSEGILHRNRENLAEHKRMIVGKTNRENVSGTLTDALTGADIFIGVSQGGTVTADMVRSMGDRPIIFAMANPDPEILPDDAVAGGAFIVGTGRSDFQNQINNVLAFPGVFRGALDSRATAISESMKMRAVAALAGRCPNPTPEQIVPDVFDETVAPAVAAAVSEC